MESETLKNEGHILAKTTYEVKDKLMYRPHNEVGTN
jgi:hypothetical protein